MSYLILKTIHVLVVLTWVASLIANAWLLVHTRSAATPRTPELQQLLADWKRWDRRMGSLAMLLVWGLGLALAGQGHWWSSIWLRAKLLVVFVMSALHGVYAGEMRRTTEDPAHRPRALPPAVWLLMLAAIVALVILKPA